jgi:uncharacterized membrane protein YbhN (UPF0104 family)
MEQSKTSEDPSTKDDLKIENTDFPALYQSANEASINFQKSYFLGLSSYLFLIICAAGVSFLWPNKLQGAIASLSLFLVTLGILVWVRFQKSDDLWYNWRAVAESVKTRAWRWMMRAEPYENTNSLEKNSKDFIKDLRTILSQNKRISSVSGNTSFSAISEKMKLIRGLSLQGRLEIYKKERIIDQADWYKKKSLWNKKRATQWFLASVFLHSIAIVMLIYRISKPDLSLPIGVIATAASSALTWLQAKKHNELNYSYSLAAHEITLILGEASTVKIEEELSDFVMNSESAFSREHTQWAARKNE